MKQLLIGIFALLFSVAVHADYVTAAYVDSDLEVDTPFHELLEDDANGFMIGYGWETSHNWLAIELTYTDFGDSNETIVDEGYYYDTVYNNSYQGEAVDLWLVGRFSPVNITQNRPLNIVPRLGLSAMHSRATINRTIEYKGNTYSQSVSADDSTVGYAYGIGLEVANVIQDLDVYIDWRKHEGEMVYAGQVVDFDPSSLQFGVNWHF